MRIVVGGGRYLKDRQMVWRVLDYLHQQDPVTMLAHGGCSGADFLAELWAKQHQVPSKSYLPDWQGKGKAAGPIRNGEMLRQEMPNLVVAFPGGSGTRNLLLQAESLSLRTLTIDGFYDRETTERG